MMVVTLTFPSPRRPLIRYKSNYSAAGKFRPGAEWGFQQGCDFALNKCAAPGNPPTPLPTNPPHFCDGTSTARTCSTSR